MKKMVNYNVFKYINSIFGVKTMTLDNILHSYSNCKRYELSDDVSEYMEYVTEEPFYISPSFTDVKTDVRVSTLNPKFVLFSAPGATGKSSLAKFIANKYGAIYWNLAKVKIGTNSFAGSILNAVGPAKYSEFIADLNLGKMLLIIDAFDEAEIVSGRKMISSFISDISNSLNGHVIPSVFLLARTETAQFIASFCAENSLPISHYEIGFFEESAAKSFIEKSIVGKDGVPSSPDRDCVKSYYDVVKKNITPDECVSFLGYAPVLEAISKHIKTCPNRSKMISDLSNQKDCVSLIMKIMDDLLVREQEEKVKLAFYEKCKENYPRFIDWDKVYSLEEQLVRIVNYVLFEDTQYDNYRLEFLPPQLIDEYQEVLNTFLPQHPFVRKNVDTHTQREVLDFTGPAFRDYTLAKLILNCNYGVLASMYFEESQSQSYFPSQIFFDCYMSVTNGMVYGKDISYVYDSYRAKATALEYPFLQCTELISDNDGESSFIAIFGTQNGKNAPKNIAPRKDIIADMCVDGFGLRFEQLRNISVNTPGLTVKIGDSNVGSMIYNSSIICKTIELATRNISIESYEPEGCLIVAQEGIIGDVIDIDIVKDDRLKVYAPNISSFYRLIPYKYELEDTSNFDITKFIHALGCILIEFRTHGKDTLAKNAERIENVTVGNSVIKREVLNYLKYEGIVYKASHLYKINETKMQYKGIHFAALSCMNTEQLNDAFIDFCKWRSSMDTK